MRKEARIGAENHGLTRQRAILAPDLSQSFTAFRTIGTNGTKKERQAATNRARKAAREIDPNPFESVQQVRDQLANVYSSETLAPESVLARNVANGLTLALDLAEAQQIIKARRESNTLPEHWKSIPKENLLQVSIDSLEPRVHARRVEVTTLNIALQSFPMLQRIKEQNPSHPVFKDLRFESLKNFVRNQRKWLSEDVHRPERHELRKKKKAIAGTNHHKPLLKEVSQTSETANDTHEVVVFDANRSPELKRRIKGVERKLKILNINKDNMDDHHFREVRKPLVDELYQLKLIRGDFDKSTQRSHRFMRHLGIAS